MICWFAPDHYRVLPDLTGTSVGGRSRRARDRPPGNRPQGKIADGHFATRQHRVTNRLSSILRGTFRVPGVHPGTGHYRICSNRRLAMPETMSLVALGSTNGHLYKAASWDLLPCSSFPTSSRSACHKWRRYSPWNERLLPESQHQRKTLCNPNLDRSTRRPSLGSTPW